MFEEEVVVILKKTNKRQTLQACVFDDINGEVLSEDASMDTSRKDIQLLFFQKDFGFLQSITRGDVVERLVGVGNGEPFRRMKYTVSESYRDENHSWVIKARSI